MNTVLELNQGDVMHGVCCRGFDWEALLIFPCSDNPEFGNVWGWCDNKNCDTHNEDDYSRFSLGDLAEKAEEFLEGIMIVTFSIVKFSDMSIQVIGITGKKGLQIVEKQERQYMPGYTSIQNYVTKHCQENGLTVLSQNNFEQGRLFNEDLPN